MSAAPIGRRREEDSGAVRSAVILAAGLGSRLSDLWPDLPKGFVEIGGESLIERSLRLLREREISRVVIVAGHLGEAYEALAKRLGSRTGQQIEVVHNPAYADTGSMASLAVALRVVNEDFLLLESDLLYEGRALDALLAGGSDVLLASGPTGATDEVWVEARDGRLAGLSKRRDALTHCAGELVGLHRISAALGRALASAFESFEKAHGHGQMAYETDALVTCSAQHPIDVLVIPDLLWGEVDYEAHYRRVRDEIQPEIARREGGAEVRRS